MIDAYFYNATYVMFCTLHINLVSLPFKAVCAQNIYFKMKTKPMHFLK